MNNLVTAETPIRSRSLWGDALRRMWRRPDQRVCLGVILLFTAAALWGEFVFWRYRLRDETPPYNRVDMTKAYRPPQSLGTSVRPCGRGLGPRGRPLGHCPEGVG